MTTKEEVLAHLKQLDEKLEEQQESFKKEVAKWAEVVEGYKKQLQERDQKFKRFEAFEKALAGIIGFDRQGGVGSNPTPSGNVDLVHTVKEVRVKVKTETVEIDTGTNRGKILYLAAKGFFSEWKKAGEVIDELEKRGWGMNNKVCMMELANVAGLGYLGRMKRENQFVYKVPDEGVTFKT